MTRALDIRDALVDALVADEPAGVTNILTDLRHALARDMRPAIVVEMGDEDAPVREYSKRTRSLALTVRILADGADPFAAIETIRTASHAAIMADTTLGGLCETLDEGPTSRDRADLDVPIGSLTTVYTARFVTSGITLI